MIRFVVMVSLILGGCSQIMAAQYITMNTTEVIKVNLSSRNHNRIGMVGDRIKKAFFRNNNITVDVEEVTGQIFIQSARPNCPETTLSVVSVSGLVQDLELCFCDIPSEIVLLQPVFEGDFPEQIDSCSFASSLDSSSITDLVESIIKGNVPEGYCSYDESGQPVPICGGLKMQRVSRFVNESQIVFVYRLQNPSNDTKQVTECKVNILDGDWVFMDRYQLKANECALVLIGCLR